MSSGRLFLAAAVSLFACAALSPSLRGQESAQGDTEGKHIFLGVVNANSVYVRSRSSEDAYATRMLKRGDEVTVVGIKGNWLKIVPPPGSFAYVPKSFVILRNDGTVGRMSKDWIARVGSSLNELAVEPMAQLHEGEDVQIIGQHAEYFEITPPKDSYLWINKQFVDPKATVTPEAVAGATTRPSDDTTPPPAPERSRQDTVAQGNTETPPTTRPSDAVAEAAPAQPPTTQPAKVDVAAEFDRLEKQFTDAGTKSIVQQPLPELLSGYQKLMENDDLPVSMRRMAEIRVATLQVRNDAREKFLSVQADQKKMAEKQQSLLAERQEIEDRIKQNDLQVFAAVGTLRTSSLQVGQGTLYRLTDPATGRTVAYIRTNDSKYGQFLGEFIGVRGTVSTDPQLKAMVENPTDAQPVDPAKVNVSIAAQFVPPSLVKFSQAPTATPPVPARPSDAQVSGPTTQPANAGTARTDPGEPQ